MSRAPGPHCTLVLAANPHPPDADRESPTHSPLAGAYQSFALTPEGQHIVALQLPGRGSPKPETDPGWEERQAQAIDKGSWGHEALLGEKREALEREEVTWMVAHALI